MGLRKEFQLGQDFEGRLDKRPGGKNLLLVELAFERLDVESFDVELVIIHWVGLALNLRMSLGW